MAQLDIRIGDRLIRPTANEQALGGLGAAALALGLLTGSSWLKLGGLAALGSAAYSVWEESTLFAQPEAMNAYFQTGGATSALSPRGGGSYETPAELAPGSYDTGAAAPVLAGVGDGRRRGRRGR